MKSGGKFYAFLLFFGIGWFFIFLGALVMGLIFLAVSVLIPAS